MSAQTGACILRSGRSWTRYESCTVAVVTPWSVPQFSWYEPQVVIVNNHPRQQQPPPQQQMGPPQLVIARPRGDGYGTSPADGHSPQFPPIPPFGGGPARDAGPASMETPASSSQSQPQLQYHKQV